MWKCLRLTVVEVRHWRHDFLATASRTSSSEYNTLRIVLHQRSVGLMRIGRQEARLVM